MNYWQSEADELKSALKELHEWVNSVDWMTLPEGVKRAIYRGELEIEEKIKKYEEWARKESTKAE